MPQHPSIIKLLHHLMLKVSHIETPQRQFLLIKNLDRDLLLCLPIDSHLDYRLRATPNLVLDLVALFELVV